MPETLPGAGIAVDGDVVYANARFEISGQVRRERSSLGRHTPRMRGIQYAATYGVDDGVSTVDAGVYWITRLRG